VKRWLRDWWRGWSDEDLANALVKIEVHGLNPGAIIPVTRAELEAFGAYQNGYELQHTTADQLK
jgi:hypothetical protein